ncbi:phosphate signaling complex protein PhoU [Puniceicoccales bacterium CK1056]|uniref:Phosphate-specific transport system accessory protein PhoU n=1 Tax=Oceanipulchritudo coccoides TaxID=2706888 RepID=A0A6B2M0S8_9BACT|nr:phosphate signaling complex protein PhoU [Oceanipulchritudo coccoides]NDV61350.1 phosphate signaling complex protein PhoU [Oceanipulchritudo coccoides]
MKRFFHSELETMRSHLLLMGEKANAALEKGVQSLTEKDLELAKTVIREDDDIDALEIEIDHEATRYLTLRSPVASDLRLITVAIKASHDLERVGDEARNIAKRSKKLMTKGAVVSDLLNIPDMAQMAGGMLQDALQCFIAEDPEKAYAVLAKDSEVDALNKENFKGLIKQAKLDPEEINKYLDLIFISKSLERIADHATNLAEEVIFLTTGKETRHQGL